MWFQIITTQWLWMAFSRARTGLVDTRPYGDAVCVYKDWGTYDGQIKSAFWSYLDFSIWIETFRFMFG